MPASLLAPISAGLGIVAGGAQFFDALAKEKKAKAELSRLSTPFYKIQKGYEQNLNQAGVMAGGGMPAASKDYYTSESQRGLGASISSILQGGGSPDSISKIFDVYNKSIDQTAVKDATQRIENIKYFQTANKDYAGQQNIQWGVNEYQPYQNKLKEITQRREAAEKNKWGGIQTAVGSLSALGTSLGGPPGAGGSNPLIEKLFPTQPGSNLSNGFPMGIDPTTGLPPVAQPLPLPSHWKDNQPFGQSSLNPYQ